MSRVSLSRRMAAVEKAIRRRDPLGYAVHNLPPKLRHWYDEWQAKCDRAVARHENAYEAVLEGRCDFPRMPQPVAAAIALEARSHVLRCDCTVEEARDAYNALLGGD